MVRSHSRTFIVIEWNSVVDRRNCSWIMNFFFGSVSCYFACCRRPRPVPTTPDCRPSITHVRKMRIKWSCASARTLSMERALRSFSWRPTCRPPRMTPLSVRMDIGLQVRFASVRQIFSGSSSVVSCMHAHPEEAHKARHLFGHVAVAVCGHLLQYPMVVLAGDSNRTAFLQIFRDDFNTAKFPSFSRLFLTQLEARSLSRKGRGGAQRSVGHDHLNMELPRMAVSDQTRHVPFVLALKSAPCDHHVHLCGPQAAEAS